MIKFTHEISDTTITFLDHTTSVRDGEMSMDLHNQPTDGHQYLPLNSCHPNHCNKGIPYNQSLRIRRICSSDDTTNKRLDELRGHLLSRGYKLTGIDRGGERAQRDSAIVSIFIYL